MWNYIRHILIALMFVFVSACAHPHIMGPNDVVVIPLVAHVSCDDDITFLQQHVARANALIEDANVRIHIDDIIYDVSNEQFVVDLDAKDAFVLTSLDIRQSMHIHVFVFSSVKRVLNGEARVLYGMFVRKLQRTCSNAILISKTGMSPGMSTLAHELGHLFGLKHTVNKDGVMTSAGLVRNADATFDARQVRALRARSRGFVRRCARHDR